MSHLRSEHHHRDVAQIIAVIVTSLGLHAGVARALPGRGGPPPLRPVSQVEIAFVRPPAPVVIPPQAARPSRPRPRPALVAPAPPAPPASEPPSEAPPQAPVEAAAPVGPEGTAVATSTTAPGTASPAAPVVAAHVGANYLQNPRPIYPPLALSRGWQGKVLLRVQVGTDGRPIGIAVANGSGRQLLDDAAVAAVRGWSFVPARQGGVPVTGFVTVPLVFQLQ